MLESDDEFQDVLRSVNFDQRYLAFCKDRIHLEVPGGLGIDLESIKDSVERLPLTFRYMKSENFFRYKEKIDESTLLFHLSVSGSVVTPMIYLDTPEGVLGDTYPMLASEVLAGRHGSAMPAEREFALCFSDPSSLYDALEFSVALFMDARAALQATMP